MKAIRFGVDERPIPLLAPQDITTSATATSWLDMKDLLHASFLVQFGNIAATSADQGVVVTMLCATGAATTGEQAFGFSYRLSGAVGTDSLGAKTAVASTGVTIGTTDDNKLLLIDVDPAALEGVLADARYVRANIAPDAGASATLVGAIAVAEQAYAQATPLSAS